MKLTQEELLKDDEARRVFEEEYLYGEVVLTIEELMEQTGLDRVGVARGMGVSKGRVSQVLAGKNVTLKTLADIGVALGYRFKMEAEPIESRVAVPQMSPLEVAESSPSLVWTRQLLHAEHAQPAEEATEFQVWFAAPQRPLTHVDRWKTEGHDATYRVMAL